MTDLKLQITGLDCVDCAKGLEGSIASLPGVDKAELSFFDGTLTVSGTAPEDDIRKMVTPVGLRRGQRMSRKRIPQPRNLMRW